MDYSDPSQLSAKILDLRRLMETQYRSLEDCVATKASGDVQLKQCLTRIQTLEQDAQQLAKYQQEAVECQQRQQLQQQKYLELRTQAEDIVRIVAQYIEQGRKVYDAVQSPAMKEIWKAFPYERVMGSLPYPPTPPAPSAAPSAVTSTPLRSIRDL